MNRANSSRAIAIIGLGVRCAVGLSAPAAAASVRAGISRYRQHDYMIDKAGELMVIAEEPTLDPKSQGAERFTHMAEPALLEALRPLGQRNLSLHTVQTFIGMPDPRPGLPVGIADGLARLVARVSGGEIVQGTTFVTGGNAAGILAIKHACESLHAGRCGFGLAGGVDSYLTADSLEWMDERRILKSSVNRNGFTPGEAAGFCLLTTEATAFRLGLPVLAWLSAVASAREESPIRTDTISVGRGLSEAIRQTTKTLRLPEERIDESICDLNGEPYRSEEFAFTVLRTQKAFVDATRFVTPADCWGDVGAASGPLFVNLAAASGTRGYAEGPRTLIWASSENGDRAAAIVLNAQSGSEGYQ
jgi:3-oxoacyl-[acyl-carrier-protein] synthase-1